MSDKHSMSGGEAMIRAAQANGISCIFGIPGAQIYPMFDAMYRLGIETIVTKHEQGAAYMAFGYAKATGKPSAFAVVPGPGVLNTTAALCTAMGANAPVLCLTGQVPSSYLGQGRGHLHELKDQAGTLRTIIKDAYHISEPAQTSSTINEAFKTLLGNRPGPVSVEMCWDTMAQVYNDITILPGNEFIDQPPLDDDQITLAAKALAKANNPMIMCGAGAQHASEEVLALAELLQAPVTAFRSGRGVVSEDHALGVSSVAARALFDEVDVLVGIGSRLEMIYMRWNSMQLYEKSPQGGPTLIRIDIDEKEMERLVPDIPVVGDAATACTALYNVLLNKVKPNPDRASLIAAAKVKTRHVIDKIQPQMAYLDVIREVLPRDGFLVPEVSQMGFTSYYGIPIYEPRTYVTEGFQGTLGYGFQTALGVKVACPDKAVIAVTGDGGLMFGIQELATAVSHNIGVITLVFNNQGFANIRRDQTNAYAGRLIGADFDNPDFVKLAESFGARGYLCDSPQTLRPILEKALLEDKPALIEIKQTRGSEVSPWEFIMLKENPFTQ